MSYSKSCGQNTFTTRSYYVLGTVVSITAYGENPAEAIDKAADRLMEIDDAMSCFKADSEVSRINSNAGGLPQKISNNTFFVIQKALYYSNLSNGAFDLTIRPLLDLWGFGRNPKVPEYRKIIEALDLIDYNDVITDKENLTVSLRRENQAIDLGSIAKGYASDEVKKIMIENEIENAVIDLGGNIYVHGSNPDGCLWNVGIQDPCRQRGDVAGIICTSDKSVVTSGGYERFFEDCGEKYHHIIDPRTGYPCNNGIISATVISEKSVDADGLSTCVYNMGLNEGLKLIESVNGAEAVIINKYKEVYVTSGLKENFRLVCSDYIL